MTKNVIAIDPGHPSYFLDNTMNFGTKSADGLKEVEVNLEIALLALKLKKGGGSFY